MTHFFEAMGSFPARIVRQRASGDAKPQDDLLALAKAMAPNPEIITPDATYLWRAEISNNSVDSYFTRMGKSSLRNYADASNEGVAFLTSHDIRKLAMGRSIQGKFVNSNGDGKARVESDFYTLTDLNLNGISTNDFIRGVEAGIVSDVSIGFHGGEWICNICGKDMARWWADWPDGCEHLPGTEYDILDKKGKPTGEVRMCVADIENAGLSEVSAVYDGATPGAAIRKALSMAEEGKLPLEAARRMEERYQHRFKLVPEPVWSIGFTPKEERMTRQATLAAQRDEPNEEPGDEPETPVEETATEVSDATPTEEPQGEPEAEATEIEHDEEPTAHAEDEGERTMDWTEELRAAFAGAGLAETPEKADEGLRALVAEVKRLRPLADDGEAYRRDLIEETVAEGIRAFGAAFPEERRRATLAKLDLEEIKGFRTEWKAAGDERAAAGRSTTDAEHEAEDEETEGGDESRDENVTEFRARARKLPANAYSA